MNWIKNLFGLGEVAGEYFKERQKLKYALKNAKLEGRIAVVNAKAQAKIAQQKHYENWEMAQIANSGIKDEIVLGVVLAPYVGSFIPVVQDYVKAGFGYLGQMPYWAVGLTVTIILAVYGIRHRNATKLRAPGLRNEDVDRDNSEPRTSSS